MRLKDKVAIVTGGASGFGAGIAEKFVAEGARVTIADLDGEGAEKKANELKALSCQTDVSSPADKERIRAGRHCGQQRRHNPYAGAFGDR